MLQSWVNLGGKAEDPVIVVKVGMIILAVTPLTNTLDQEKFMHQGRRERLIYVFRRIHSVERPPSR
jgi:hypothetical protein